jgi:glycosyltransferase involved in cell wall biosynthesis
MCLKHLLAQRGDPALPWEVLLVDNASTDATAEVARSVWPTDFQVPLRIVHESALGLSNARWRSFLEARYEVVSFIDDDNWVSPDWVRTAHEVFDRDPELAACGGFNDVALDSRPPAWFDTYKWSFAVGPQGPSRDTADTNAPSLWGAGLTVRLAAWRGLQQCGFVPLLRDRTGSALSGAGDTELCLALRLAGWQLRYESRLRLTHFLPSSRLQWSYLRRLHRAFGASTVGTDPYYAALEPPRPKGRASVRRTWEWQSAVVLKHFVTHPRTLFHLFSRAGEGNPIALSAEGQVGRLRALVEARGDYNASFERIGGRAWAAQTNPSGPEQDRKPVRSKITTKVG